MTTKTDDTKTGDTKIQTIDPGNLRITQIKTGEILRSLQTTFDTVSSGKDYNKDQVKNMTNLSNAMVKVLRFEFDVYKFFMARISAGGGQS